MGSNQSLREISASELPGGNERPERKADNISAIAAEMSGIPLDNSDPYGTPWTFV
jgi:hypothetical protein